MAETPTTKANKATASISKLPPLDVLLKEETRQVYLPWRHSVFRMLAKMKILHLVPQPLAHYQHYMSLPPDAPLPIIYARPTIAQYGDADVEFTIDQLKLISKLWELIDAITLNLVTNLDQSIVTHIRSLVNVDNADLPDIIAALDAKFLAPSLRQLSALYHDLSTAQGITSISELIQYVKYLEAMQLLAGRVEDTSYIVTNMSACLNRLGYNAMVLRYHEIRGDDPEEHVHLLEFLTAQQELLSYKVTPDTPTQSGLLNPVMASQSLQIAGLADQVRTLTLQLAKVTALTSLHAPPVPRAPPANLGARGYFCSTHGPGFHTSANCKKRSPKHCLTDTLLEWTNQQQHLDYHSARPAASTHG
jgi:hypothetical protein